MVKKELILEKIGFIKLNLTYLKLDLNDYDLINKNEDDEIVNFNDKRRLLNSIKREIEEIVETLIKINTILLKDKKIVPSSYRNSFLDLEKIGLDNLDNLDNLSKTAIFRNELAHDYITLTEKIIILNSNEILKLYPKFLIKIINYIN